MERQRCNLFKYFSYFVTCHHHPSSFVRWRIRQGSIHSRMLQNADEFFVHVSQMLDKSWEVTIPRFTAVQGWTDSWSTWHPKIVHADFTAVQADNLCKLWRAYGNESGYITCHCEEHNEVSKSGVPERMQKLTLFLGCYLQLITLCLHHYNCIPSVFFLLIRHPGLLMGLVKANRQKNTPDFRVLLGFN